MFIVIYGICELISEQYSESLLFIYLALIYFRLVEYNTEYNTRKMYIYSEGIVTFIEVTYYIIHCFIVIK